MVILSAIGAPSLKSTAALVAFLLACSSSATLGAEDPRLTEARALHDAGSYAASLAAIDAILDDLSQDGAPVDVATAWRYRASCLEEVGTAEETLEARREEVVRWRQARGEGDHPDVALSLRALGFQLILMARFNEAIEPLEEASAIYGRLVPRDRINIGRVRAALGRCLLETGHDKRGLAEADAALAALRGLPDLDPNLVLAAYHTGARCLEELGRDEEAVERFLAGIQAFGDFKTPEDATYGTAYIESSLARTLDRLGRYDEALTHFEEALRLVLTLPSPSQTLLSEAKNDVAYGLGKVGRRLEAIALMEEALLDTPASDPLARAVLLSNLGQALSGIDSHQEGLLRSRQAVRLIRGAVSGDHPDLAGALSGEAACLAYLGRPAEALPIFKAALSMHARLGDTSSYLKNLAFVAYCHEHLGLFEDALNARRDGLAIARADGNAWEIARRLHGLGMALIQFGHPEVADEGEAYLMESLAAARDLTSDGEQLLADVLNNVALVRARAGDPSRGLSMIEEALTITRRLHPEGHSLIATSLTVQARCLEDLGRHDEALQAWVDAVDISRAAGSQDHHYWATGLAKQLIRLGREPEARGLLLEAIDQVELQRAGGSGLDPGELASFFSALRRARPYSLLSRVEIARGRADLAFDAIERGRGRALMDLLQRGGADLLDLLESNARREDDEARSVRIQGLRERLTSTRRSLGRARASGPEGREDVEVATREYREALRDRAALIGASAPAAVPVDLDRARELLGSDEALLLFDVGSEDVLSLLIAAGEEPAAFRAEIGEDELTTIIDDYRAGIDGTGRGRPPGRLAPDRPREPAAKSLFTRLIPAPLWEKLRSFERVLVVADGSLHRLPLEVLQVATDDRGAPQLWIDTGPTLAYAFSTSMFSWSRARQADAIAASHTRRLAVGDPVLPGRIATEEVPEAGLVVIEVAPGGPGDAAGLRLRDVITEYAGHPIADLSGFLRARSTLTEGELVEMTVWRAGGWSTLSIPSGSLGAQVAPEEPRQALAIGRGLTLDEELREHQRAAVDGHEDEILPPLPGSRREVLEIARVYDPAPVEVLIGPDATKQRVLENAARTRVLHFATHHVVDPNRPRMGSALVLSPANADDGRLRLDELLDEWGGRLRGCELVVLSACETLGGRTSHGEGIYSVPWGFLHAGAASLVVTLWSVPDDSTAVFMSRYHQRLAAGEAPVDALAATKRAFRADGHSPRAWAPFIHVGAP